MKKSRILSIIGTRPEAIKLAPVILELRKKPDQLISKVCVTGQHRELLGHPLAIFGIRPDYNLNIMSHKQTLAHITALVVRGLDEVVSKEKPDILLVQGDTTTALCGALVGFYHKIKTAHVEAGLRTGNKYAPFPEEINRRLLSQLADWHFAPTEYAKQMLIREGIQENRVFVTGNPVIDALLWMRQQIRARPPELPNELATALYRRRIILVTGHRRESFGKGFENICDAIREVADLFADVSFIYPVHLNPRVQEPVRRILGSHPRILLVEPLPYAQFVWLMDRAEIILTDSGGVQEEAPSMGKPILVMRETTERPEGVAAGNAMIVGTQKDRIVGGLAELINNAGKRSLMAKRNNPYGDGHAAQRIVDILARA